MSTYLLDTHTFLWYINGDKRLSLRARAAIESMNSLNFVSIATFWEMAIKVSIGKLKLEIDLKDHVIDNGFSMLLIDFEHTCELTNMDYHHKDPFDRILIAQSKIENLVLIGKDTSFKKYNIEMLW